MQDNDIGGAEDTVVPLSPVPNNAVNQSPIVKTTPEPCHFNGDVINEVDNADTGRRSSLNNSNTEIPAESLIQIEDLVVTSTVPVIVYNENQGIHRNKHTTDSRQTQTVPIVSNSKSVPIIHSDDDTSTKSEVKERILSAKVPTIVYNENNICNDKNVIKSQEHHVQKVTAVDQTPIANKSKDNIATTKSKAQLKESVKIAAIPTIVYNQNVDSNCNKRAIKAQGHHSQKAIYATKKSFCPAVSKHRSKQIAREKESLELNNSKVRESRTELELEKIFNNMKMTFEAVTPIPKTPTKITEENSISDPSEKLLKCMMLSDKSDQLLIKLKEYMHCLTKDLICQSNPRLSIQSHTFGSKSMSGKYNIDKLIKCFETILGSEQILSEDSINVPQNIQISEKPLANEENNLVSIIFEQETDKYNLPEVTDSMHADTDIIQEDTHILQNHQEDFSNLSSENIQSPDISIPEKDIIILLNFQDEKRLSPQNSQPLEPKTPLAPSERPGRAIKRPGRTKIHKEAKKALCSDISLPEKDIIILQNFQDEKQLSPQNSQPQEPKAPLSPSNKRPGRAEIHKEANKVLCSPPKLPITPLSPRLRSFTQNEQNNSSNSPPKQIKALLSPRSKNAMQDEIDQLPQKILITPRTKRKISELFDNCAVVITKDETILDTVANKSVVHEKAQEENESPNVTTARRKRRQSSDEPVVQPKRILRSSNQKGENIKKSVENTNAEESTSKPIQSPKPALDGKLVQYDDLDMWSDDDHQELVHHRESVTAKEVNTEICHPKESILCCMVEKYGVVSVKPFAKKVPDNAIKQICEKIEKEITAISELPMNETKAAMNKFVADLRKLNYKHFISGMMKYLTKPERKQELFGKISLTSAPAMTKAEQILLYVVAQLKTHWPLDIVDAILSNIEYTLFRLNRTPEFDVIESMSHFYALLCRYIGAKSRLRLFILDAMYCIQYKSVPLIKQCIEIWMHIIPLAHMGIAKNPLVTCLVYLLHFYKCDDKSNRVQEIRNILSRKYFYQITDWNETKILEMFKNCIKDLKDISIERKTLRLALIILAKRHGPRWCQNNIIKNLLQPMIENEGVSDNVKEFCVSMIGPLMKPYPVDMKIYCEIAMNQLTDILNNNPSPKMEEAAITSMLFINRHNQDSVNKILLSRKMKPLSPDLEKTLSDYVKTKPLNMWKKHLSIIARAT